MKKSLVALAVLAASGASFAQSTVTLYGVADIYLGATSGSTTLSGVKTDTPSQTVVNSGGVSGSRWGLKGSEDLGGGLKANFNLEQGFDLDSGAAAGTQFNRQAYVGFSGGFGEVKLGHTGTAYDDIRGTNNNTFDSALAAVPWVGYNGTPNNAIYYAMPAQAGFNGAASYALGEDKSNAVGASGAGSLLSFNVQYAAGPFMVGYAYQKEDSGNTMGLGALTGLNTALKNAGQAAVVLTPGTTATYNLITGSYDLGVAKLLASYNTAKFVDPTVAGDLKFNEYQLGADIPLSAVATLAVGFGESKAKANVDLFNTRAFSAAIAYSLSKRTTAYAGFNDTKLTADAVANTEAYSRTFAAGIKHTF